ncbi:MAG TPA: hypothetical protein VMT85_14115 [Thermoanaerobaculia bacterium]|nr:hypothetical protein [Thermoanaerobaculia bacterium]
MIALQIALTMVFPLMTQSVRAQREDELLADLDLASEQCLSAHLDMEQISSPAGGDGSLEASGSSRLLSAVKQLEAHLLAEPRVAGVTFTDRLPREYPPVATGRDRRSDRAAPRRVESPARRPTSTSAISRSWAARWWPGGFRPSDLDGGPSVVVVNDSFVELALAAAWKRRKARRARAVEVCVITGGSVAPTLLADVLRG